MINNSSNKQNQVRQSVKPVNPPTAIFRGNNYSLNIYEDWIDKTLYTLTGPVTDGIQHNIIITHEPNTDLDTVEEFGEWQIQGILSSLKGCMLLKKGAKKLQNGMDAYEAIFSWYPTDELRIYQQQIYVLHEKIGYKITASFTKKTRKTLGPQVERMMLSFNPIKNSSKK
ncbi:MAG: DcrB-related protein [Ignavibacteriae bacterium]|nr:DUF1795 domain-containing protein [Ignavibacteriota bacterium]NOG96806.1 DcrB-related protein [Ignavibacteriota bacterium]